MKTLLETIKNCVNLFYVIKNSNTKKSIHEVLFREDITEVKIELKYSNKRIRCYGYHPDIGISICNYLFLETYNTKSSCEIYTDYRDKEPIETCIFYTTSTDDIDVGMYGSDAIGNQTFPYSILDFEIEQLEYLYDNNTIGLLKTYKEYSELKNLIQNENDILHLSFLHEKSIEDNINFYSKLEKSLEQLIGNLTNENQSY